MAGREEKLLFLHLFVYLLHGGFVQTPMTSVTQKCFQDAWQSTSGPRLCWLVFFLTLWWGPLLARTKTGALEGWLESQWVWLGGGSVPSQPSAPLSGFRGLPRCYWTLNSTQANSRTTSVHQAGPPSTPCMCWRVGAFAHCSSRPWRPPASAHGGPQPLPTHSVTGSADGYRALAWQWAGHGEPWGCSVQHPSPSPIML